MVEIWLPYGKTETCATIPAENYLSTLEARRPEGSSDCEAEIERALAAPLDSRPLRELVNGASTVAIVFDHGLPREVAGVALRRVLQEVKHGGISPSHIKIFLNTTTARHVKIRAAEPMELPSEGELNAILEGANLFLHNPFESETVEVGVTSLKTRLSLNREFAKSDVKIAICASDYHPFAGYSWCGQTLFTTILGARSMVHLQGLMFDQRSRLGQLEDNPLHASLSEATRLAGVNFAVTLAIDGTSFFLGAAAGSPEAALRRCVSTLDEFHKFNLENRVELLILSAGGAPYDDSFASALASLDGALGVVKEGGVIVFAAECREGHGDEDFHEVMGRHRDVESLRETLRRELVPGGLMALRLLKVLSRVRVFCVSAMPEFLSSGVFKLRTFRAMDDAVAAAFRVVGRSARVYVVPHGRLTVARAK